MTINKNTKISRKDEIKNDSMTHAVDLVVFNKYNVRSRSC